MSCVMIVAPHPDDETLGCGGTILRSLEAGDDVHWVIVTEKSEASGASAEAISRRNDEINTVSNMYGFTAVHRLGLPESKVDARPFAEIVGEMGRIIGDVQPQHLYLPYPGDIHSDHRVTFEAAASCTKWFRYPSITRVLAYETLSETDFSLDPNNSFRPGTFVNIASFLEKKIDILNIYHSELGEFPFPRSIEAVRSLAGVRGAAAGCRAAEAFMLLREVIS